MTPRTTPPPLPKTMPPRVPATALAAAEVPRAQIAPAMTATVAPPISSPKRRSLAQRALVGLLLLVLIAAGGAWLMDASIDHVEEAQAATEDGRARLGSVTSWAYQLQRLDVATAAAAPHDLIVVDETLDGSRGAPAVRATLSKLKRKADGQRRIVLSYLSIGEAEDYRPYWNMSWAAPAPQAAPRGASADAGTILGATPANAQVRLPAVQPGKALLKPTSAAPGWLGAENPEWRGNYGVRFWNPEWKSLLLGHPGAALDRIIAAGFDGVYLDRADVYNQWRREHPTAKADMAAFVVEIAVYARQRKPGFLVMMQNAEELLSTKRLRDALDGVAKEDLLYGIGAEGRENSPADVEASLGYLRTAKNDGLPVLVVEYQLDGDKEAKARRRLDGEGFVSYFGPRLLNTLQREH